MAISTLGILMFSMFIFGQTLSLKEGHFAYPCTQTGLAYSGSAPLQILSVRNVDECGMVCLEMSDCKAFNFLPGNISQNCEVFDLKPNDCSGLSYNADAFYMIKLPECDQTGTSIRNFNCNCKNAFYGELCEMRAKDCTDYFDYGWPGPVYQDLYIWPNGYPEAFQAPCQLSFGGKTEIQSNEDCPPTPQDSFHKNWEQYKNGFSEGCKYWIGLEKLHYLTTQRSYDLNVGITAMLAGKVRYNQTTYTGFWIDSEDTNYKLHMSSVYYLPHNGAGDSLFNTDDPNEALNGQMFSTYDRDNDNSQGNCAQEFQAGFWFNDCAAANPNGWVVNIADSVRNTSVPSLLWKHNFGNRPLKSVRFFI